MELIQSTLSPKNQTVIPSSVRKAMGLKAGAKLSWKIITTPQGKQSLLQALPANWTQTSLGLGAQTWQHTNIDHYLDDLRNEWPA